MTYRVIQWGTGKVGKFSLGAILDHPDLELTGVWVHSADKVGQDAGELLDGPAVGIAATNDADSLLALGADCVCYDDDVEFVVPGDSTISGTYRGKDGVKELFGKVAEQNYKITPDRFLAVDDVVVVLSQVTVGGESGLQADEFTYRNGKIVKAQNYGDTGFLNRSSARSSDYKNLYVVRSGG